MKLLAFDKAASLHLTAPLRSLIVPQLSRYSVVSAMALALDLAIYLALLRCGVSAPLAGVIGYAMGLTLHFSFSTRFVFDAGAANKPEARLFAEFAVSGLVGLAITAVVITAATELFLLSALAAKVLAAGTSFAAVFMLRCSVVFAARP